MKHYFNTLKNATKPSRVKLLDPNPNTIKKLVPDTKIIKEKSKLDFESYIDTIFKENPHLSETEMFEIYHNHKPTFDKEVVKRLRHSKDTETVSKLAELKLKMQNDPNNFSKIFDQYVKEYSKLTKMDN